MGSPVAASGSVRLVLEQRSSDGSTPPTPPRGETPWATTAAPAPACPRVGGCPGASRWWPGGQPGHRGVEPHLQVWGPPGGKKGEDGVLGGLELLQAGRAERPDQPEGAEGLPHLRAP